MSISVDKLCQKKTDSPFQNDLILDTLKCSFCDKFLSVPPIFHHETETICGRCQFVDKSEDSKWSRQTVYENLAKFIIFPCSNTTYGCKAQLQWGEVEEHENTCLYRKLTCPFFHDDISRDFTKCRWVGSGPSLNEHLENWHGDLIKKLPEVNFLEIKDNQIFLTRILKQLMVVMIKYEPPEKLCCLVMVNGTSTDCDAYRYQLELYDENRKNSIILRRSRLEDAVGFVENFINKEKQLIIELSTIRQLLKQPNVIMGRFGIIKKSKKELSFFEAKLQNEAPPPDESFLRDLECPICKNYLIPPIHICNSGHSFCLTCREQLDDCPTCKSPFNEGRNYTLEKLTTSINYPCMYREVGCHVTCTSEKLKNHESECTFSGSLCVLNCSSSPVLNMFKHLNEKHQESLIVCGDLQILDVGDEDEMLRYFAVCFGNDIFRLAVRYDGVNLMFGFQQFGVEKPYYIYEVEIICSTECTEKIAITKECGPMNQQVLKNCISIPEELIEKFISEEDLLFYKIYLKKIA